MIDPDKHPEQDPAEGSRSHPSIAQAEIQPFRLKAKRKCNECHYYRLPLPESILEKFQNTIVELKVTLSYLMDPNPGFSAKAPRQKALLHCNW